MEFVVEVTGYLVLVKEYGYLMDALKNDEFDEISDKETKAKCHLPCANTFLLEQYIKGTEDSNLFDVWKLLRDYLNSLPQELKTLKGQDYLEYENFSYFPSGEALVFINLLNEVLEKDYTRGNYFVEIYDLNSDFSISFETEEAANYFADLVAPSTVFEKDENDNCVNEIAIY